MTSPSYPSRVVLWLSALCATTAFVLALIGVAFSSAYGFDWRWKTITRAAYDASALLLFQSPKPEVDHWAISTAQIFVLLYAVLGTFGVFFELYQPFREFVLRTRFRLSRGLRGPPAIVIGLGRTLGPLAATIRQTGRGVFAVDQNPDPEQLKDARDNSVLVLTGDARDAGVRGRADLTHASEIFIATGDDGRNVEIASRLLADLRGEPLQRARAAAPLTCYVEASEPTGFGTLNALDQVRDDRSGVELRVFSRADLAARDLFFRASTGLAVSVNTVAGPGEIFHLFLFGFGPVGQAVGLHVARFAHFPALTRPRLTVCDHFNDPAGASAKSQFLECFRGFAPDSLDLSSPAFLSGDDGWVTAAGTRVVEHAVNAEFISLPAEIGAPEFVDLLIARISASPSSLLQPAAVFCFDEEGENVRAALRLRTLLARRLLSDGDNPERMVRPLLPMYLHVTDGRGLAALLDAQTSSATRLLNAAFPLHRFGDWGRTAYEAITRAAFVRSAREIARSWEILAGRPEGSHPDFLDSNLDAAIHAEHVKLPAMGIVFEKTSPTERRDPYGVPLLATLSHPEVILQARRLVHDRWHDLPIEELLRIPIHVRRRLALLYGSQLPAATADRPDDDRTRRLRELLREAVSGVIDMLRDDLTRRGRSLDLFAAMEHNRWMGERLVKGWRFGPRSDVRCQRPTFVPWDDLSEADRDVDRAQLARLILGRAESSEFAYVTAPVPQRTRQEGPDRVAPVSPAREPQ